MSSPPPDTPWLSASSSESDALQRQHLNLPQSPSPPPAGFDIIPYRKPVLTELTSGTFSILNQRFFNQRNVLESRIRSVTPFSSFFEDASTPQDVLFVGNDLPELPYLLATQGEMIIRSEFWRSLNKALAIRADRISNQTWTTAILHIGQPGIGKSVWLLFALVVLIHGQPVVFSRGNIAIFFKDGRVFEIPSSLLQKENGLIQLIPPHTIALVDSDDQLRPPPVAFTDTTSPCFMIFSAPPQPVRFKSWRKYKNAKVIVMAEWEPSEVVIGSTIHTTFQPELNEGNLTAVAELLRRRFDECGPVARHLFADVQTYKKVVQKKKDDLEWLDFAHLEQMIKTPEDGSHGLVLMSRQTPDLNPLGSDIPVYSILNRATMDSIFNRHLMQSADQLRKFSVLLSSCTSYASSLGWLFESYAHRHLSDPTFRGDTPLIIKKMRRDGSNFISNSSASPVRLSLDRLNLTAFAPKLPPSSTTGLGSYFISAATKNPAYDLFFFLDVDSTGSPALDTGLHGCTVQASIASSHTCEPSGMADVTARFKSADVMSRDFIVVIPAGHQIKLEGISSTYLDKYDFWSMEVDTGFSTTPTTPPKVPRVVGLTAPTALNVPDVQMDTDEEQSGGLNRIDKQLRLLSFV